MDNKIVIFVAIASILVAAIYGSSISVAYATVACAKSKDGKTAFCTDSVKQTFYKCSKDTKGHWSCQDITAKETGSTNIPPALNNAIVKAQSGATTGGNETTSSGLRDKIIKGNDFLKDETLKNNQNLEPENSANGNATIQ
jgi:hypothetical protein